MWMNDINGSKGKTDWREASHSGVNYLYYNRNNIMLFEGRCGCVFQSLKATTKPTKNRS